MRTQPDATGGQGSFGRDLWGILSGGLGAVVRGEVTKRYGSAAFQDLPTVAADGSIQPAGAPTPPANQVEVWSDKITRFAREQPIALAVIVAAAAFLVTRLARA